LTGQKDKSSFDTFEQIRHVLLRTVAVSLRAAKIDEFVGEIDLAITLAQHLPSD
jgi:hypothetical protein